MRARLQTGCASWVYRTERIARLASAREFQCPAFAPAETADSKWNRENDAWDQPVSQEWNRQCDYKDGQIEIAQGRDDPADRSGHGFYDLKQELIDRSHSLVAIINNAANHQPAQDHIDQEREEVDRQDRRKEVAVNGCEQTLQSSDSVMVF